MSNEIVVGHIEWLPEFDEWRVRTAQLKKIFDEGRIKLAPRLATNGAIVSVDVIAVEKTDESAPRIADLSPDAPPKWDPGTLLSGDGNREVSFTYTNWKGEASQRQAIMCRLYWGANEWHKEPQWLIEGFDMVKGAVRTYAMRDVSDVKPV